MMSPNCNASFIKKDNTTLFPKTNLTRKRHKRGTITHITCFSRLALIAAFFQIVFVVYKKMKHGNINKTYTVFAWSEKGVRKTHRINKNDLLINLSLSGDEVIIQQKDHPTQFIYIDAHRLHKFLTKKGGTLYVGKQVYDLYPEAFHNMNINVVYPSHTRRQEPSSTEPHDAQQNNKKTDQENDRKQETSSPVVQELSSDDDDDIDTQPPPRGLYVWINDENKTIEKMLCENNTRKRYLAQSKGVREKCTKGTFDHLDKQVTCSNSDTMRSCMRKLLFHLHPDKLDSKNKECGMAMFQELSEAHAELKRRPGFNEQAQCT